ncbi:MAG: putative transport system permease protein [Bacillota bacterium]|nr:putative transport system permease protein [Bacillota bacterium]
MILLRKMLRDIGENKTAYLACAVVLIIGLLTYTGMLMARDNLFIAREQFYREYRLADGFAQVRAMPYTEVKKLAEIEGIAEVQGRLVKDVRVLGLNEDKNIYLRFVSLDQSQPFLLNGVQLLRGAFPHGNERALLLGDKFFTAHRLSLGQPLTVAIDGKKVELPVAGSGQSPEFVYAIKGGQNIFPDPAGFEVAYLPYTVMESLFNQKGRVNDIVFTLRPGYKFEDVEPRLKAELTRYGLESLIPRKDQASNAMLTQELDGLAKMAQSVPVLFLTIAALILYIMLKRLVEAQRGQIGTLKAFGYRPREILLHYLSYGLLVGLVGGVVGGLLGTALSFSLTRLYAQYFSLPNLSGRFSRAYFVSGVLLSTAFSLFAAYQGTKGVLRLRPADALHPPVPLFKGKSSLERLRVVWAAFTVPGRMAVRNALRNRARSLFTLLGVTFTFSLMAVVWSLNGLMDTMVLEQFTKVQQYDVKISFTRPLPLTAVVRELEDEPGVKRVEPLLEVPVTLQHEHRKKSVAALGLSPAAQLYTPLDKRGSPVAIPEGGVVLSEQVAAKLEAQAGDRLRLESVWAKESPVYVDVAGIVPQYLGANVYLNQNTLLGLLRQGEMATSLVIAVDKGYIPALKEKYETAPYTGMFEERRQAVDLFRELIGSSRYMLYSMALLAVVTGFAIVYNSSIISLAERKRELASLRVLGMRPGEVLEAVSVEQWLLGVCGIIAGIPLTAVLNQVLARSMSSDLYSLPAGTTPAALLEALLGTMLAIWLAQQWVARRIRQLDLVEVLKERE